ncbi:MAG TPA: hypothetical protein PLS50_00640 [Candidatus Dojkabacteria bacterium]|nr:hypothetical protein [Candidatus Dojkabacteria bacterium]
MKYVEIRDFNSLSDACIWVEQTLYDMEIDSGGIKGELLQLPDGRWRGSVITDEYQMELAI